MLPLSEKLCLILEERYRQTLESGAWGERFSLPAEDKPHESNICIFHNERASYSRRPMSLVVWYLIRHVEANYKPNYRRWPSIVHL